ncbi:zinc-ribbon domain-containing protein [Nocardia sp. CY41]|uniref:zinc-ribbon domain-containing protein n=1 Tax=Nocardia sp. CY41 TaxID=2608686 RepID=UPI00191563A2|nr:zinc-ribbon domain-containing protein [Nocardia sp. CY41]
MLIWGWQKRIHTLAMITLLCGRCGNPAAHALRKLVTKFTLFFIPLFPLSTKHHLECTWCGASSPVAAPQLPDLLARANAETMGPARYHQHGAGVPNAQWPQQPASGAPHTNWQQPPAPNTPHTNWQR